MSYRLVFRSLCYTPARHNPQKDVELNVQTQTGESLAGVKMQFIAAKGAPEIQYTDSNGYAKVQIPSQGDVRVTLSKEGYPTQDFTINLTSDQSTTRTIRLNQIGQPKVSSPPQPPLTTTASPTTISRSQVLQTQQKAGFLFALQGCQRQDELVVCSFLVTNKEDDRLLKLMNSNRIIDEYSNQFIDIYRSLGSNKSDYNYVSEILVRDVPLKGSVTFKKVSSQLNRLLLLELSTYDENSDKEMRIQFRNVSISS